MPNRVASARETITIEGVEIPYRLRATRTARGLRIRVGVGGVEVASPPDRDVQEVQAFLRANGSWLRSEIDRAARVRTRALQGRTGDVILYQGRPTRVAVERREGTQHGNRVERRDGELVVLRGKRGAAPAQTLERWLREEARRAIEREAAEACTRLNVNHGSIYIMDQRTKWGNCSRLSNLSFQWRLILAPDFVLRYVVMHETTHLAIPNHSQRFWLTLKSLCAETGEARHWLGSNRELLMVDLAHVLASASPTHGRLPGAPPPQRKRASARGHGETKE